MPDLPQNRTHQAADRLPSGRFAPGVTGNPGGRPKAVRDVAAAARELTADAIATLAQIMKDPNEPSTARIAAANSLLSRGWGRPPQAITVSLPAGRSEQVDLVLSEASRSVTTLCSGIDGII